MLQQLKYPKVFPYFPIHQHLTIPLRACFPYTGNWAYQQYGGEFNSLGFVIEVSHWSLCRGKTFLTNIITGKKPPND